VLVVPCALLVLSVVAMAWSAPGHGDGHGTGSSGCWEWWRHHGSGCPPPAPPTTRPPWRPPPRPPWTPPPKPTTTSTTQPSTTTTSTTQPSTTPATVAESTDAVPVAAPDDQVLALSARDARRTITDIPAASPPTDVVAAPVLPGLPQAVPRLEQPEVPPAASFEDDVLLPGSVALVIAVAGLATAFLVYQGAAGRRGPRGPSGPVDDGETLEFW